MKLQTLKIEIVPYRDFGSEISRMQVFGKADGRDFAVSQYLRDTDFESGFEVIWRHLGEHINKLVKTGELPVQNI